jgi:hypothetical protein
MTCRESMRNSSSQNFLFSQRYIYSFSFPYFTSYFFLLSLSLPPFRQCYMTSTAFKGTQYFVRSSYCSHDERRRVMTIKCCSELSRAVLTMPPGTYTSLQVELTFHSCNKFPVFTTSRTKSRCTLLLLYILHKFSQLPPIYSVEHPSSSPVPPLLSTTT